jgi:NADPH:quinone reductase-like Zn-dependent oxidoreductase
MSTYTAYTIPLSASSVTHLTKLTRPIPTPGPKQVLVKITAASLNYRDVLIASRSPQYPGDHKDGLVPGTDGAGVIDTLGEGSMWKGKEGLKVMWNPNGWMSGDFRNLDFGSILGGSGQDGTYPLSSFFKRPRFVMGCLG